jgi:hypothetical protein
MTVPNQDDPAWDLVDATRTSLDIPTINRASITIASGDYAAVIEILLGAASRFGEVLHPARLAY